MNESTENLVLEILRRMQADMAILRDDMRDVKTRLSSIEGRLAHSSADHATQSLRIDRLEDRLERIEHRLDIHDPTSPSRN
jgi:tetrahydromethanopterin S-methyltransferase subunit G